MGAWRLHALSLVVFLAVATRAGGADLIRPATPELKARVDTLFADFDRPDRPGYAVGIVHRGQVMHARGYGSADLSRETPLTPISVFNIASLSKQFTAACVALLIRREQLALEDQIRVHLPEFPERFGDVRIKHLVYMTSGLPEYYTRPRPAGRDWDTDFFTVQDAIRATFEAPGLEFRPGERWAYSNVNYQILAEVVARISGRSFATFAQQEIFHPLGMNATLVHDDLDTVIPHRVTGYNVREDGRGYRAEVRHAPHYGGSGVFSSVEDLVQWDRSLRDSSLGGPELTALLLRTMRFEHDKVNDAFGLVWGNFRGRRTLWYEGGDRGFSSYMVRLPDDDFTVIVLSNLGSGRAAQRAQEILELFVTAD